MKLLQELIRWKLTGGGAAAGGYELLGSGSYTWAGGSSTLSIPISFTGTPKLFGLIADEPLADTAQMVCVCKLGDGSLFPDVFHSPDRRDFFVSGWGRGADNATVHEVVSLEDPKMSASQMVCTKASAAYPWRANTYSWYIWGVKA